MSRARSEPAPFIRQLADILGTPRFRGIVEWQPDGIMFAIKDIPLFMREIATRYFRISTFKSFSRQMNMYDFHKCKMGY